MNKCVICQRVAVSNNDKTKEWLCVNCLIKNSQLEAKKEKEKVQNGN